VLVTHYFLYSRRQRRREEDSRRTVGNYRTTVETLKLEKQALLELQQGGEGTRKNIIASSQKALAKAAQLVADGADMRKREARTVMDKIDHQIYRHLSTRLESLLPPPAAAIEVAAIKGELLTSKVVSKAAQSLSAISKSFGSSIRPPIPAEAFTEEYTLIKLSDEAKTEIAVMFHQTEFALDIAGISSHLLRFLAAGQWPDLLSSDASTELGSLLGHSLAELDNAMGHVLVSLKEEGSLTPEQSNIERLRQAARNTIQHLESDLEREDGSLVPTDWVPPGLELMKDISISKFSCMGAAAALSSVVHSSDATVPAPLAQLYSKVEQCSAQASSVGLRMANLDVKNSKLIAELDELASAIKKDSSTLLQNVKDVILAEGDVKSCETSVEATLRSLAKIAAMLRSAHLQQNEEGSHHAFSPEADDTWDRLSGIARALRTIDGDVEDVNYLFRARQVEHHMATAVENEPKLEVAEIKIVTLEKVRLLGFSVIFPVSYRSNTTFFYFAEPCFPLKGDRHAECSPLRTRKSAREIKRNECRKRPGSRLQVIEGVQQSQRRKPSGKWHMVPCMSRFLLNLTFLLLLFSCWRPWMCYSGR
jgi:dynactin 1